MLTTNLDRPIILGIVGDSASGKTTLSDGVAAILGPENLVTICSDDYHSLTRAERLERGITALNPDANHLGIFEQHLKLLRQGQPILKPVYDHRAGTFGSPVLIEPKPYIVVEGLLGYATRAIRDCYDVKIYLEPDEDLRVRWKVQRDVGLRGYSEEQVIESLARRIDDSPAYIHPQRAFADIVISFYPPADRAEESGAHLNVRHVLRPTLPHPDLTPILDPNVRNGIHLELARDPDGKPVDVLEIAGSIADDQAAGLEDLLWDLIPEAGHLRANLGQFTGRGNAIATSHPLALTQLAIAYHMVKAALGIHAI